MTEAQNFNAGDDTVHSWAREDHGNARLGTAERLGSVEMLLASGNGCVTPTEELGTTATREWRSWEIACMKNSCKDTGRRVEEREGEWGQWEAARTCGVAGIEQRCRLGLAIPASKFASLRA